MSTAPQITPAGGCACCAELARALDCYDVDELQRLLWRTHDVVVEIEDDAAPPHGRLRLRCEDAAVSLAWPVTVDRFWDEVDQLEAYVREAG